MGSQSTTCIVSAVSYTFWKKTAHNRASTPTREDAIRKGAFVLLKNGAKSTPRKYAFPVEQIQRDARKRNGGGGEVTGQTF